MRAFWRFWRDGWMGLMNTAVGLFSRCGIPHLIGVTDVVRCRRRAGHDGYHRAWGIALPHGPWIVRWPDVATRMLREIDQDRRGD